MLVSVTVGYEVSVYLRWPDEVNKFLNPITLKREDEDYYRYDDNEYDWDELNTNVLLARYWSGRGMKILGITIYGFDLNIIYTDMDDLETVLDYIAKQCNPVLTTTEEEDELVKQNVKLVKWDETCKLLRSVDYTLLKQFALRLHRIATRFKI